MTTGAGDHGLLEAVERHAWEAVTLSSLLPGARLVERPGLRFVDSGTAVPFYNAAASMDLGDAADETIAEITGLLRERSMPGMWWPLPSGGPADVRQRLEAAGWTFSEAMPWMARIVDGGFPDPPSPEGLEVRRVTTPDDQAGWVQAMREGFGIPDHIMAALDQLGRAAGTEGPWLRFVARFAGLPVGSAGVTITGDVAGLYNVTTLADARRRGVATATTTAALSEVARRGVRTVVLGTTEMGRSIYERLGFQHVTDLPVLTLSAAPGAGAGGSDRPDRRT